MVEIKGSKNSKQAHGEVSKTYKHKKTEKENKERRRLGGNKKRVKIR